MYAEVAEQSIARVCKTRALTGYLGANPSLGTVKLLFFGSESIASRRAGLRHTYFYKILC